MPAHKHIKDHTDYIGVTEINLELDFNQILFSHLTTEL